MIMGCVLVIVVSGGPALARARASTTGEGGGGHAATSQPTGPTTTSAPSPVEALSDDPVRHRALRRHRPAIVEFDYRRGRRPHAPVHRPEARRLPARHRRAVPEDGKVELKPGKYTIYCTVTGHAAQGMWRPSRWPSVLRRHDLRRTRSRLRGRGGAGDAPRGLRRWRRRRRRRLQGAQGPVDRDDPDDRRRATSTSSPTRSTPTPGSTTIKLVGDGGIHTLVFDDGKEPGFQLEVAATATRREEDRPEAGQVHLLLRHPGPPRSRAWKARSPSSSDVTHDDRSARGTAFELARAAGPRARRSPTARAASSGVGRSRW